MNVYEMITDRIIRKLEEGIIPWRKPWNSKGGAPKNLITKKEYRGINVLLLNSEGYSSPYWLTYKQAAELGGNVKKGEKGTPVIYWNWIDKDTADEEETRKRIPFLKYYTVFNLSQCENINEERIPQEPEQEEMNISPIEICEYIIDNMPNKPGLSFGSERACYSPSLDKVKMPDRNDFACSEFFYSVFFHELTHSTGHQSRLSRPGVTETASFGSDKYSKEELVAEMGAAFLCAHAGIENKTIDNSAAYIQSWLERLKNDKKLVVLAAAQAQKAADFILNRNISE